MIANIHKSSEDETHGTQLQAETPFYAYIDSERCNSGFFLKKGEKIFILKDSYNHHFLDHYPGLNRTLYDVRYANSITLSFQGI